MDLKNLTNNEPKAGLLFSKNINFMFLYLAFARHKNNGIYPIFLFLRL